MPGTQLPVGSPPRFMARAADLRERPGNGLVIDNAKAEMTADVFALPRGTITLFTPDSELRMRGGSQGILQKGLAPGARTRL